MMPPSPSRPAVADAIDRGDLDALVRLVEALCRDADWEGLLLLRDRSRAALERGLQLWPAAEYAEYRLAREAPGPFRPPRPLPLLLPLPPPLLFSSVSFSN